MSETITPQLARRIALSAQGFGGRTPTSAPGSRALRSTIDRLGLVQIDSVNVFERSHYLPLFARLGAYDKDVLDKLTVRKRAPYLEYWAHEAAFIPRDAWPLFRWRMEANRRNDFADESGWAAQNPAMLQWVLDELREKGPLRASEIEHDANVRQGPWWGWSDVKRALETLFRHGDVVTAGRDRFERRYALPEQVLDEELLGRDVSREDAIRELVRRSAAAHGIATLPDLADYFRIKPKTEVRRAIEELVDAGELEPVTVPGWDRRGVPEAAWIHRDAKRPRRIEADALLSPFDPVVWFRERALRMYGLHYRIEIYTPAPKRVFGYYVLPVLLDDAIAARVDLKSDRQAGVLRVQASWLEQEADPRLFTGRATPPLARDEVAHRLARLLERTAAWQGLDGVVVADRGTLAGPLAAALGVPLSTPLAGPGAETLPDGGMGTTPHAAEAENAADELD
ncbi:winged helix-turn-helix domain-containing protein [Plantibacter sp. YIM 135249]|uniref:winged helix-turn-helix domain-containing protein n=1 Tax=Plantibacter sp. YIM 135249 TaxID=3423918 RepID=UPI003D32B0E4